MTRPSRVQHVCWVCGYRVLLRRRTGGLAWELEHRTPTSGDVCAAMELVPVT